MHDKLDIFIACAPIVNLANTQEDILVKTSQNWRLVQFNVQLLNIWEIRDPTLEKNLRVFCSIFSSLCDSISAWFHIKSPYTDDAAWALQNSVPQSGASSKQILHYSQIITQGVFRQYDYGNDNDNVSHYGSKIIPLIRLTKIGTEVPIALLVGKQDTLADETDVNWL